MTAPGLQRLEEELKHLKAVERPSIIRAIVAVVTIRSPVNPQHPTSPAIEVPTTKSPTAAATPGTGSTPAGGVRS